MNNTELSKVAYDNAQKLTDAYTKTVRTVSIFNHTERRKITDEFTIAFNGLSMLMSERDLSKAIQLLHDQGILSKIVRSIKRIRNNKSLAFIN